MKRLELGHIKTLFPQANSEGTLTPYAPQYNLEFVYAKSGNLRNNHALAGYIFTDTKKPFSFVISVNNYTGTKKQYKQQSDSSYLFCIRSFDKRLGNEHLLLITLKRFMTVDLYFILSLHISLGAFH